MTTKDYAVSVRNLSKFYDQGNNKTRALDNVSLNIKKGEFLMITGRNGSGKSTLMHLMALLDKPTHGEIFIKGDLVSDLSEAQKIKIRLESLGYIFQEYALIQDLTALENVMLPAMMLNSFKVSKQKAIEVLKKVYLDHKYDHIPSQLSGGEQQRVAIARSLINDPKILFADEPTANLDTIASKEVMEIFKELNQKDGITIIMVTHESDELPYSSRTINLKDGTLDE